MLYHRTDPRTCGWIRASQLFLGLRLENCGAKGTYRQFGETRRSEEARRLTAGPSRSLFVSNCPDVESDRGTQLRSGRHCRVVII